MRISDWSSDVCSSDRSATLLDDTFTPPAGEMATTVCSPDADDPRIVLDLEPAAWWVAEAHPVEEREERPDGRLRVTLAIGATAWLERLLVGLGATATVVSAPRELDRKSTRLNSRH